MSQMVPGEVIFFPAGTVSFNHWREIVAEVLLKKVTVFDDLQHIVGSYPDDEKRTLLSRVYK
jgi:hypothetical protein